MFPASSELKSDVNQGQKRRKMARQMFQRTRDKRGKTLLERGSFTRSWNSSQLWSDFPPQLKTSEGEFKFATSTLFISRFLITLISFVWQ